MGIYAGSDWIKSSLKVDMSPLGVEVADLIGDVWRGVYHLRFGQLKRVNWSDKNCIEINLGEDFATWDFNTLTILVVLSHDRMIRVEMRGISPGFTKMYFTKRKFRTGSTSTRLPTIEEHIQLIRNHYGVPVE